LSPNGLRFKAAAFVLVAALMLPPANAAAQAPSAMTDDQRVLAAYTRAHDAYLAAAAAYWSTIADKRKLRFQKRVHGEALALSDYVLTQPPVYTGPPKPPGAAPKEQAPPPPPVPVVADFLKAARQEYNFTPRRPQGDTEFKRAYAEIAAGAGLTRDQAVRIYGFEATGNGGYDVQAGLEYARPAAHAITTALGYNQLLSTNSVELLAESGATFVARLEARAALLSGASRAELENTIAILRRMIGFARSVPDDWSRHEALADTPKGLAIHAMNLDIDVGPLLQTQKLLDSVVFARREGYDASLSAAELEMMNLTGDGNGFDMIGMPAEWRGKVPTANFFQRRGYADNPVAQRHNTVAALIAATDATMDQEVRKDGAKTLAAAFPK